MPTVRDVQACRTRRLDAVARRAGRADSTVGSRRSSERAARLRRRAARRAATTRTCRRTGGGSRSGRRRRSGAGRGSRRSAAAARRTGRWRCGAGARPRRPPAATSEGMRKFSGTTWRDPVVDAVLLQHGVGQHPLAGGLPHHVGERAQQVDHRGVGRRGVGRGDDDPAVVVEPLAGQGRGQRSRDEHDVGALVEGRLVRERCGEQAQAWCAEHEQPRDGRGGRPAPGRCWPSARPSRPAGPWPGRSSAGVRRARPGRASGARAR